MVTLRRDGKTHLARVHRLVAKTFLESDDLRPHINHKNGIKTDNRVDNLEWVTRSENEIHKNRVLGKVNRHKLTTERIKEIYAAKNNGISQNKVAALHGVSRRLVGMIWNHSRHALVTINAPNKN